MNERYDPLGDYGGPAPAAPPPQTPSKKRSDPKLPALVKAVVGVPDATLAFLYTADRNLEQNRDNAAQIREGFIAFCKANSHFTDWRQAWSAFMEHEKARLASPPAPEPVKTPADWRKAWRRRLYRQ